MFGLISFRLREAEIQTLKRFYPGRVYLKSDPVNAIVLCYYIIDLQST